MDNIEIDVEENKKKSMVIPRRVGTVASHNGINDGNKSYKESKDEVLICIYNRVSSNKLDQLCAFDNQVVSNRNILQQHPNWKLVEEYNDRGLSGTQVGTREGFQRMLDDAKKHKFQLIVCREISRFSRNILDTIQYTRLLRSWGIECAFINDNIYTLDPDGELRLTIMGGLAQDSSRHTSERSLSGQVISREKKVLYGHNLFGYFLIKTPKGESNRYVINLEQAETVRMIFEMYLDREMGYKAIVSELIAQKRKNASGNYKWDATQVGRILKKRAYAGYIVYGQSYVPNYLDHKRKNLPEEEHLYVKAEDRIPPIISDEQWLKAREKRRNTTTRKPNQANRGKPAAKEKWIKVLKCSCSSSMKRFKWRTNQKSGEPIFGYQCANQVNHRKKGFLDEVGLDSTGYCSIPSLAQWKLEMQLGKILRHLWENPENTVVRLMNNIQQNYQEYQEKEDNPQVVKLTREKERLERRKDTLLEMRLDGDIDKEEFRARDDEYTLRISQIDEELDAILGKPVESLETVVDRGDTWGKINNTLIDVSNFNKKEIDESIVESIVDRVVPYDGYLYKWYINLSASDVYQEFSEEKYVFYNRFIIKFDEARAFRKRYQNYLRENQWNDITTEVYIRL